MIASRSPLGMLPVQIVVAEGNREYRQQLCAQLRREPDLKVIGEVSGAWDAMAEVGRLGPEVLLLDLELPGTSELDLLGAVEWCSPSTKVIILSDQDKASTVFEALKQGAKGFILKDQGTDLSKAIRAVHRGEVWAKRGIVAKVIEELIGLISSRFPLAGDASLSC